METEQTNQNKTNYVEPAGYKIANPVLGKKIMIGMAAVGFAMCFSGILFGNQIFILGFVVMLCSAVGHNSIAATN